MATRRQVLKLYKSLMSESKQFPSYNFRSYALRRIRDAFKSNKEVKDERLVAEHIAEGAKNLEIIKRQVLVGKLYATEKLVIENLANKSCELLDSYETSV